MTKFKWTVEFTVDETWVADGFNLTDLRALHMLSRDLAYADMSTELSARVIKAPDPVKIAKAQGYEDTARGAAIILKAIADDKIAS